MKYPLLILLGLALCLSLAPSCSHVQTVADDACAAIPSVVSDVDVALGSDAYDGEIDKIAAALCAVRSAVEQVAALQGQKVANKLQPDVAAEKKYVHAVIWLEAHRKEPASRPHG